MTTRYKGRKSSDAVEAAFPHIVEMKVPPNGFGGHLNAMFAWHQGQGIQARNGPGRIEEDVSIIRWCFADPQHARSFQALFGGETKEAAN